MFSQIRKGNRNESENYFVRKLSDLREENTIRDIRLERKCLYLQQLYAEYLVKSRFIDPFSSSGPEYVKNAI